MILLTSSSSKKKKRVSPNTETTTTATAAAAYNPSNQGCTSTEKDSDPGCCVEEQKQTNRGSDRNSIEEVPFNSVDGNDRTATLDDRNIIQQSLPPPIDHTSSSSPPSPLPQLPHPAVLLSPAQSATDVEQIIQTKTPSLHHEQTEPPSISLQLESRKIEPSVLPTQPLVDRQADISDNMATATAVVPAPVTTAPATSTGMLTAIHQDFSSSILPPVAGLEDGNIDIATISSSSSSNDSFDQCQLPTLVDGRCGASLSTPKAADKSTGHVRENEKTYDGEQVASPSETCFAPRGVSSPRKAPPSSILRQQRSSDSPIDKRRKTPTERRVKGIWSNDNVTIIGNSSCPRGDENGRESSCTTIKTPHQIHPTSNPQHCHVNPFEKFRDETLTSIFSFLDLADLLRSGMVCRRWYHHVKFESSLWNRIDASTFCQCAYRTFFHNTTNQIDNYDHQDQSTSDFQNTVTRSPEHGSGKARKTKKSPSISPTVRAQRQTGRALESVLQNRKPDSLIIRNIGDVLSADHFQLPSQVLLSLQELSLSHFNSLSDTHLHVLLLMMLGGEAGPGADILKQKKKSTGRSKSPLRHLALEHCKLLTNSSLSSIATTCGHLVSLSLSGNSNITVISPLQDLFVTKLKDHQVDALPMLTSTVQDERELSARRTSAPQQEPKTDMISTSALLHPTKSCSNSTPPGILSLFSPPQPARNVDDATTEAKCRSNHAGKQAVTHLGPKRQESSETTQKKNTCLSSLFDTPVWKRPSIQADKSLTQSVFSPPPEKDSAHIHRDSLSSIFSPPALPTSRSTQYANKSSTVSIHSSHSSAIESAVGLSNLFNKPGTSPPRRTKVMVLDSPSDSVGRRRYQRHHRSFSSSVSPIHRSPTYGTSKIGSLDRLDLRQTGVVTRDLVQCFLELSLRWEIESDRPINVDKITHADLWCWICLKALYVSPAPSLLPANEKTGSLYKPWKRQDLRLLEHMLLMEEVEELHLGDGSGYEASLVTGGQRSDDWLQFESRLVQH